MADRLEDLRRRREASEADLVELRLDGVADLDVAGALQGRSRPVVVTCRAAWEGGRFDGSEEERLRVLEAAVRLGAEYVDIEWRANHAALPGGRSTRVVLSHHDFERVPLDLKDRVRAMRASRPDAIVKVAVMTRSASDLPALAAAAAADRGHDHVFIGMGAAGLVTRACPARFGSLWTYGGEAAPGQVSVGDLSFVYRVRSQTSATRLFALTGRPLGHSASPAMHNAVFAAGGLDAVYVPLEAGTPDEFLAAADALDVEGASVTAPLKTGWSDRGVACGRAATDIGAVNTLTRCEGIWRGDNFDADAFMAPLRAAGIGLRGARCVVLGAGGAARAAVWALAGAGARVAVSARRAERAAALSAAFAVDALPWPPAPGADLLVNATSAGTWPGVDDAPVPRSHAAARAVYDLVYCPRETTLLKWAREAGAMVIGGLDMLVAQAARQSALWTGTSAPEPVLRGAAEAFLARRCAPGEGIDR